MKLAIQTLSFRSNNMFSWFFNIVFVFTCYLTVSIQAAKTTKDFILLISYDGFRHDYLEKFKDNVPTLRKIAEQGSRPEYVQNVFPTETFPNHYTLVTGLYPESHGIVANNMYDPVFNASFTMMTNESRWWNSAEPIWVTNERQGHKSGNCFWPGYDVKIKGHTLSLLPNNSYGKPFVESKNLMSWEDRVDLVVSWFSRPDPPTFVALYFEEPDEVGHANGTKSLEMAEVLSRLDNLTSYLMKSLKKLEIFERINFIFTSDHGMINVNLSTLVNIDKYVDPASYIFWKQSRSSFMVTNSSYSTLDGLYEDFKKAEKETKGFIKVYKKEEVPKEFHYSHNRRIADLVGMVTPGYLLNSSKFGNWSRSPNRTSGGTHGYTSTAPSMHPYLIAYGPAFKQGYRPASIHMVDLYPLMCHILAIEPLPNNGSLGRIKHILQSSDGWIRTHFNELIVIGVGSFILVLSCITAAVVVWKRIKKRLAQHPVKFNRNARGEWDQPLMDSDEEEEVIIM